MEFHSVLHFKDIRNLTHYFFATNTAFSSYESFFLLSLALVLMKEVKNYLSKYIL